MSWLLLALLPLMPLQADSLTRTGDPASAADTLLSSYDRYLSGQVPPYSEHINLARRLAHASYWPEAITVYTDILAIHTGDPDARLGRGLVLSWQGEYPAAEADLVPVTSEYPAYTDAWMALGNLYLWWGRPSEAVDAYSQLVDLSPDQAAAYITRARAYQAARRFPQSRRDLRRAAKRNGDQAAIDQLLRDLNREPAARPWEPVVSFDLQTFSDARPDWNTARLTVKRELKQGSITAGLLQARRFGLVDEALSFDGYRNLWPQAYGHVQVQLAQEPGVLPSLDGTVELFHGFGRGWEASGGLRRMVFSAKVVNILGGSLALYSGDWYHRGQLLFIPGESGYGVNAALATRRYFGTVDNFGQLAAGRGREVEITGADPKIRETTTVNIRGQGFLSRRIGFTLTLGFQRTENYDQRGFQVGLITRW